MNIKEKVKLKCDYCGNELERCPSLVGPGKHFCNIKCKGLWMIGKKQSKEAKDRRSQSLVTAHVVGKFKGAGKKISETKRKRPKYQKKNFTSFGSLPIEKHKEIAKRARSKSKGFKDKHHSKESNQRNREKHLGKEPWNKGLSLPPDMNGKIVRSSGKKPNNIEKFITSQLLILFGEDYEYVGNFRVWLDGKNPDWINVNGKKKVIEFFGRRWHKPEDEQDRKDRYKKFGYDTLIIWSEELKDMEKLKKKLIDFNSKEVE